MKVGIRTGSLKQGLPEALEKAGKLGYDGLEVITRDTAEIEGWLKEDGPGGAAALRALAQRAGCSVSSLSLSQYRPVNLCQEDATQRAEGVRLVTTALRACRQIGGAAVLLPHFDRVRLDVDAAEEYRFIQGLRACAAVAEETGVAIAIETSFSVAQQQRVVNGVGSRLVGVYADLANAIIYQQDPAASLRDLGSAIVMLHIKDTRDGGQAMLGEGTVDWAACRAAVSAIGYDGWAVLETPAGDDPLANAARNLAFTRQWLAS